MESGKEKLLQDFMRLSKDKSSDDMLPLLLAFNAKAKEEHITFSKNDMENIFESMKKEMAPDERTKIETLIKMASVL